MDASEKSGIVKKITDLADDVRAGASSIKSLIAVDDYDQVLCHCEDVLESMFQIQHLVDRLKG